MHYNFLMTSLEPNHDLQKYELKHDIFLSILEMCNAAFLALKHQEIDHERKTTNV